MIDGILKIMIDVFLILGIVTKEAGQGRTSMFFLFNFLPNVDVLAGKFVKKLVGKNDVEDALQRLDKLTQEVARLAETEVQVLTVTRRNDDEITAVDDRVGVFNGEVHVIGHSSQQCGTESGDESPWDGGPTRDTHQSSMALLSSPSSGLYSDFGRRSGGKYGPITFAPSSRNNSTPVQVGEYYRR